MGSYLSDPSKHCTNVSGSGNTKKTTENRGFCLLVSSSGTTTRCFYNDHKKCTLPIHSVAEATRGRRIDGSFYSGGGGGGIYRFPPSLNFFLSRLIEQFVLT